MLFRSGEREFEAGHFNDALRDWQQTLSLLPAGSMQHQRAITLDALGRAQFALGRYRDAERSFQLSLADEPSLATTANLAQTWNGLREYRRAEQALRGLAGQFTGRERAHLLINLSETLYFERKMGEAAQAAEEALGLLGGERSASTVAALGNLAAISFTRHKDAEGIEFLKRAEAILEEGGVGSGVIRLRVLAQLASALAEHREFQTAEVYFRKSLAAIEPLGPTHPDRAILLHRYASMLKKAGRRAEAKRLENEARSAGLAAAGQTGLFTSDWRDLRTR